MRSIINSRGMCRSISFVKHQRWLCSSSSPLSSVSSVSSTAGSSSNEEGSSDVWVQLLGLSKHSTKEDVRFALHSVCVKAAVPYLDQRFQPAGPWAVLVEAGALGSISEAHKEAVGKLKAVRTHVIAQPVHLERLATAFQITPATVMLSQVPPSVTPEHIRYVFQEHHIKSIRPVAQVKTSVGRPRGREGLSYWVEFENEQQAAIAAQEKHGAVLDKNRIQVLHYDFIAPNPPITYPPQDEGHEQAEGASETEEAAASTSSESV